MDNVYVCSPYRGDIKRNKEYARELTRKVLLSGNAPVCPHLYITEVTNESDILERTLGLTAGLKLLEGCSSVLVGCKYGVSGGMQGEINYAQRLGIQVKYEDIDYIFMHIEYDGQRQVE